MRTDSPAAATAMIVLGREVAELFGVSLTFVNKLLRLHRGGGCLAPRPHGGGHIPRLGARHHKLLGAAVAANNDATPSELREHMARRARVSVSEATVSRALTKLGLPRKKSMRAPERNNYKRGVVPPPRPPPQQAPVHLRG